MRKKKKIAVMAFILVFMMASSLLPISVSADTVEEQKADIIIKPESITAYVGGNSLSGGHAPKLRYSVELPAGVRMEELTFKIYTVRNGKVNHGEYLFPCPINDTYYLFPQLGAGFDSEEGNTMVQRGNYLKLVDDGNYSDSVNGTYTVMKRTGEHARWDDWFISATDINNNEYTVDVEEGATVTIREISTNKDESIYDNINSYATPVVPSGNMTEEEYNASIEAAQEAAGAGMAIAVEAQDTDYNYTTNGQSDLGVIGDDGSGDTAEIALLFDDLMIDSYSNNQIEERIEEEDYDYCEMKYLDLINTKDGNAVVTTDKKIDIYWPYPGDMTKDEAEEMCDFEILHFKDMDRGYTTTDDNPSVGDVETIVPECTDYGLKFSTKTFSPFVLVWKVTSYPENGVLKVDEPDAEVVSIDDGTEAIIRKKLGAAMGEKEVKEEEEEAVEVEEIVAEDVTDKQRVGEIPVTGEKDDLTLWKSMMIMCAAGAVVSVGYRRKIKLRRK
jgi:hypothetical protein